jgi:hypothetical protein
MVPAVELPPTRPPADHVTPELERPLTVAENWLVAPVCTYAVLGVTVMLCANRSGLANSTATVNLRERLLIDNG